MGDFAGARQPHARHLRKGRVALPHHAYLITAVVAKRTPVFAELGAARCAARYLHDADVARHAQTLAFVVMPDHVHWLLQMTATGRLDEAVRCYKAKVSISLGQRLWQRGYHDHALRRDEDLRAAARYIIANPLRAGLVENIGDYPHWDAIWL